MQGHIFFVDLYILLIWRLDVILRIQWLRTLGPCLYDHKGLTMEFQWNRRRVLLVGDNLSKSKQVYFHQLRSIIDYDIVSLVYTVFIVHKTKGATDNSLDVKLNKLKQKLLKE